MQKQFVITPKPKTYGGRVNWYVSPYLKSLPIVVFDTQAQAIDYANSLPVFVDQYGIRYAHDIDWTGYGECARLTISNTRTIDDRRTCARRRTGYVNGRLQHI